MKKKIYWKNNHPISKGEREIVRYLKRKGHRFIRELRFKDCKNPKTGQLLIFDFYIPSYNTVVEFDGLQHFEYVKKFDKDDKTKYLYRQMKDEIKNKYCEKKEIKMVRIKYNQIDEIKKILDKEIS